MNEKWTTSTQATYGKVSIANIVSSPDPPFIWPRRIRAADTVDTPIPENDWQKPNPPPAWWGPEGWAGDWGPFAVVSASLIQATWRLKKVCVAAKTSGPAFLKPCWVCCKEGPTPAHRLRVTKKGRENVGEGGRAGRESKGREMKERAKTTQEQCAITVPLLTLIPENAPPLFYCFKRLL